MTTAPVSSSADTPRPDKAARKAAVSEALHSQKYEQTKFGRRRKRPLGAKTALSLVALISMPILGALRFLKLRRGSGQPKA